MLAFGVVCLGVILRQVDRWWFSDLRVGFRFSRAYRPATAHAVFGLQRRRRNNVTPVLLLAGHWIEVFGYLLFLSLSRSILSILVVVTLIAVKCRHFQELSHFGIHTALCRSRRLGDLLTEFGAQGPLALATVDDRRESHVRRHHPNANVPEADPNLGDLTRAGLHPGCSRWGFARAIVHPLTLSGMVGTCRTVWQNLRPRSGTWWRLALLAMFVAAVYAISGGPGLAAVVAARMLLYPQLAWMSLLVEHRWFANTPRQGRPIEVEAGRCVRVFTGRRVPELVARVAWLPYGDLYHFAHSVYPTVRWNYLPNLEQIIGLPVFTPSHLWRGPSSLIATLYRSVHTTDAARVPERPRAALV